MGSSDGVSRVTKLAQHSDFLSESSSFFHTGVALQILPSCHRHRQGRQHARATPRLQVHELVTLTLALTLTLTLTPRLQVYELVTLALALTLTLTLRLQVHELVKHTLPSPPLFKMAPTIVI